MAWSMLITVQCLMTMPGAVFTWCSMIVCEGADSDVDRKRVNATRYTRYALASKQRKILPVRGCRMSRCNSDIIPLSFIKCRADERRVEGVKDPFFLDQEY